MTILTERSGIRFSAPSESTAVGPPEARGQLARRRTPARRPAGRHRAPPLPRPRRPAAPRRPRGGEQLRHRQRRDRRRHAAGGRSCCTSPPGSTTAPGWWSCAPRPTPPTPVLDAAAGETIGVRRAAGDAARAVPVRRAPPPPGRATGSGAPRSRATCAGCPTGTADRSPTATSTAATRSRRTSRSSAPCPAARRWRRRGDRSPIALVTRLVARGIAVAPITLHTGRLLAGGRRGTAARVVRRAGAHRAAGRAHPRPRWPRGRDRYDGHPGPRVGRRRRAGRASRWGWTDRVVTPAHPPGW